MSIQLAVWKFTELDENWPWLKGQRSQWFPYKNFPTDWPEKSHKVTGNNNIFVGPLIAVWKFTDSDRKWP